VRMIARNAALPCHWGRQGQLIDPLQQSPCSDCVRFGSNVAAALAFCSRSVLGTILSQLWQLTSHVPAESAVESRSQVSHRGSARSLCADDSLCP